MIKLLTLFCNMPSLRVLGARRLFADIAQLVEQLIRNEQVVGSSPTIGSIFFPAFVVCVFMPTWFSVVAAAPTKVVIDPGHGGENLGAPCRFYPGCREKDLTLPLALELETLLRDAGIEVYLTRRNDKDMSISERVQFANQLNAAVFVSLHLNASEKVGPSGFMTFLLAPEGLKLAETRLIHFETLQPGALTDRVHEQFVSTDVEDILMDMTINHAQVESAELAQSIQSALATASPFPNLGVRQAPFHVLMGGTMPSVVVELGFLNHPKEGPFLASKEGQSSLARGLRDGILDFVSTRQSQDKAQQTSGGK